MSMRKNEVGVLAPLKADGPSLNYVADFGLKTCQIVCWDAATYSDKLAARIREESRKSGVVVTSLWAGWPGPAVWNFTDGPKTLGLVPRQYRAERVKALQQAAHFAHAAGLAAIATHLGFIPEDPNDPVFAETVDAVRAVADVLKAHGLEFWFETGQETPVTMLRLIQAVGTGNLGINLDPANLILYGKANPIDALDVFGAYVRSIHAKDGLYPTDPMNLGREVKVGQGRVRFPEFVGRLKELDFKGAYIIEREISGAQQHADIAETVGYLRKLIAGG